MKHGTRTPIAANQRGLLSSVDAAEYLSISESKFLRIVSCKDCPIKPRRMGANVRYKLSELDDYIDSLPIEQGTFKGNGDDL